MTTWHPLLAAEERTPAEWTLVDEYGQSHVVVRLERDGGVLGYTAAIVARVVSIRSR